MSIRKRTTTTEDPDQVRRPGRSLIVAAAFAVVALLAPLGVRGLASASSPKHDGPRPTIVLVHGDWADASSWNGVIERLQRRGFTVVAPPNPLRGPSTDAPYLASFLETIPGPTCSSVTHTGGS